MTKTGARLKFEEPTWDDLDPAKKYAVMDTMVLLMAFRYSGETTRGIGDALDGRVILMVPRVIREAFNLYRRMGLRKDIMDLEHFEEFVNEKMLDRFGASVAAGPSRKTQDAASKTHAEKKYCNKDGVCLSCVDCLMLRLAVENPNVDVLTEDATLIRAICAECGFLGRPRTCRALNNYYNRRFDVSNMIRCLARGNPSVHMRGVLWYTEYEFDGSWRVIVSETLVPSVKMERIGDTRAPCPFADERGALDAILACWSAEYGDYCRSHHSSEFMDTCTCGRYPYDENTDS